MKVFCDEKNGLNYDFATYFAKIVALQGVFYQKIFYRFFVDGWVKFPKFC